MTGDDRHIPDDEAPGDEATLPPASSSPYEDATLPPDASVESEPEVADGNKVRYFGDYELIEEIARGGMGVVYKARQINLNRIVALKMILAGQFAGKEDIKRFHTEAESAAQLDHPGIVPIFEIGEHQGQHYFSMGFVEGESLAQKVADRPLPPREAAELVKKICDAMAYAHERGVIHRDLKPANILIDRNGQPKVTDFGLAKKTQADSNLTGTGQILGTPAYMPPEQASGQANVGPLADVYSLGAILYCLLVGRPPFQAAIPMDTLLQVLQREPVTVRQLNSAVPVDLQTICLKCLEKSPRNRYQKTVELYQELDRFVQGKPIKARKIGRFARAWRWCKRQPVVASLSMAVGLLLITGTGASTWLALAAQQEAKQARLAKAESDFQREKVERLLYQGQLREAILEVQNGDFDSAESTLARCRWDFRGWEHDHLRTLVNDRQSTSMEEIARFENEAQVVQRAVVWPDGSRLAISNRDDVESDQCKILSREATDATDESNFNWITATSPSGERLVSVDKEKSTFDKKGRVRIHDHRSGKDFTLDYGKRHIFTELGEVTHVAISDRDELAISHRGRVVYIWANEQPVTVLALPKYGLADVSAIALTSDASYCAVAYENGEIGIFKKNPEGTERPYALHIHFRDSEKDVGVAAIGFDPDQARLCSLDVDGNLVFF